MDIQSHTFPHAFNSLLINTNRVKTFSFHYWQLQNRLSKIPPTFAAKVFTERPISPFRLIKCDTHNSPLCIQRDARERGWMRRRGRAAAHFYARRTSVPLPRQRPDEGDTRLVGTSIPSPFGTFHCLLFSDGNTRRAKSAIALRPHGEDFMIILFYF